MKLSYLLLSLSLIGSSLGFAQEEAPQTHRELLEQINEEIDLLEDERDKLTARAARLQDKGDRLQFQSGNLSDARRYWKMADAANQIANQIDEKIQQLKEERQTVIGEIGQKSRT